MSKLIPHTRALCLLAVLAVIPACDEEPATGPELLVFAAASTSHLLADLAERFERTSGVRVTSVHAASSVLARQIEAGGTGAALFLAANRDWVDFLERRELLEPGSRRELFRNRLVLIAPKDGTFQVSFTDDFDLTDAFEGRLALGEEHVPVGIYARQALRTLGWWQGLRDRIVPCQDVSDAVRKVEARSCAAGIVYASDLVRSDRIQRLGSFPEATHDPILYFAARVRGAGEAAERFLDFLASSDAATIARAYGFSAEGDPSRTNYDAESGSRELAAIGLSLQVAFWCTIVSLVPGLFFAWLLARKRFRGKDLVDVLVHIPLVAPPVVTGYLLLLLLGPNGPLGAGLKRTLGLELAFDWKGAVIASAVMGFPLLVRSIRLSMELVEPKLEAAGRTLGASAFRVFVTITLPLSLPGIFTGMILMFARSLGEFGATMTFVSRIPGSTETLATAMFNYTQVPGGEGPALRLLLLSLAIAFAALVAGNLLARRTERILKAAS